MTPRPTYLPREDEDPGVPEALGRALSRLVDQVGLDALVVLWIFPPLRKGRRERGVLAAGCGSDPARQTLVTLAWTAEETGKGVTFETRYSEEGEAPPDRLPRIMEGVVRRARDVPGSPERIELVGEPDRIRSLLTELDAPMPEVFREPESLREPASAPTTSPAPTREPQP
ncbi:MAG: hypothetical protein EA352_10785 [Gemmatimonadales bacterium]|nr:MAG: hypothetical protein EA352_10785 [Gemmatimonadales bacterium]